MGSTGRIVAFEPNPEILKLLRENIVANKAGNVLVEPIACTDREQTLTLWASASFNTGMSSLARENADISYEEPPRPYTVRGRSIDDVARELNLTKVNAIKVDVEGAEVGVLRGAMKTLKLSPETCGGSGFATARQLQNDAGRPCCGHHWSRI